MELDPVEQRIVGCLIEKDKATPQNYPLTLNALRLACNQSTNREPVVSYDDATIERALGSLRERKLTRIVYSTSNRSAKYRHVVDEALRLESDELAVLGILLLRGPQTAGEIKGRSDRMHAFPDLNAVQQTLDRMAAREDGPLVRRLERQPGQKDARWIHLVGPSPVESAAPPVAAAASVSRPDTASRPPSPAAPAADVEQLTAEIDGLRAELAELRAEFDRFRSQFD